MNLKDLFGTEALTWEQFEKKAAAGKAKFVDLSEGAYVGKEKFDAKEAELATANTTMKQLQDAAKKFDGVDVEGLRQHLGQARQHHVQRGRPAGRRRAHRQGGGQQQAGASQT